MDVVVWFWRLLSVCNALVCLPVFYRHRSGHGLACMFCTRLAFECSVMQGKWGVWLFFLPGMTGPRIFLMCPPLIHMLTAHWLAPALGLSNGLDGQKMRQKYWATEGFKPAPQCVSQYLVYPLVDHSQPLVLLLPCSNHSLGFCSLCCCLTEKNNALPCQGSLRSLKLSRFCRVALSERLLN